jgi:hypothetical protein
MGIYIRHFNQWVFVQGISTNGYLHKAFQPMGIYIRHFNQWVFVQGISTNGYLYKAFQPMGIYLNKTFQKSGSMTSINKEHKVFKIHHITIFSPDLSQ